MEDSEYYDGQTISYGELMGGIRAIEEMIKKIKSLKTPVSKPYHITLYSDSQFVIKGAKEWIHNWVRKGWKGSNGKEVSHRKIWEKFYNDYLTNEDYKLEFIHIKGHSKETSFFHEMNKKCDKLAGLALNEWKELKNLK
jgi:ribonuclease HI